MTGGLVGEEVAGGNVAQGVIPFEFLDEQVGPGAIVPVISLTCSQSLSRSCAIT
jgi:hypothetical protein